MKYLIALFCVLAMVGAANVKAQIEKTKWYEPDYPAKSVKSHQADAFEKDYKGIQTGSK